MYVMCLCYNAKYTAIYRGHTTERYFSTWRNESMDSLQYYFETLDATDRIALATSVKNIPSVRLVNFCYTKEHPSVLLFACDRNDRKVEEFEANSKVSLATIPPDGESFPHMRSLHAIIEKSSRTIDEVKDLFLEQVPGYEETLEHIGDNLDVFEIFIEDAMIVVDFDTALAVSFPIT